MSNKTIKIGLVGFGVVGTGVAKLLLEEKELLTEKTGLNLELVKIVDLDTKTKRNVEIPNGMLSDDLNTILNDDTIEIAVVLVGGTGIAKEIQAKLLQEGKHVVTANKALLAKHGPELYKVAKDNNKSIAFEASCAGGIPIISALRSGLAANKIEKIYGIVNGTCNYILTNMSAKGEDFPVALKKAQELGYAEADPTLDINGGDSAHKIAIMASLAFGYEIEFDDVTVNGIEDISIDDIIHGSEMGYVLKLLAIGEKDDNGKIILRVGPSFISKDDPLAKVSGPFNAISVFSHAVGQTMYYGRGAGMMATASAVVADVIETGLGISQILFNNMNLKNRAETKNMLANVGDYIGRFYLRIMSQDIPGTLSQYGKILGDHGISISGVLQKELKRNDNVVALLITTHETSMDNINNALRIISEIDTVKDKCICIPIVDMPKDED